MNEHFTKVDYMISRMLSTSKNCISSQTQTLRLFATYMTMLVPVIITKYHRQGGLNNRNVSVLLLEIRSPRSSPRSIQFLVRRDLKVYPLKLEVQRNVFFLLLV